MLPSGTVTFLFTDIEGSTQLWEKQPEAMKSALARHDLILREAVETNHGYFIKTTGDGVHAVFSTALDAIHASVQAQCNLQAPLSDHEIKVRMGVHTGEAELRDGDYYGQSLNRAARIMSVGHGRQILLSAITASISEVPLSLQGGMFYLSMGFSERGQGNYDLAKQHFENGLTVFRQLRNKNFEYVMLSELGHLARVGGNFKQARKIYKQTITGWHELGARPAVAHQLECYAFIAIAEEQPTRAAQLLGAAEALRAKVQSLMADDERVEYDQSVARLRSMLAEKDFNSLWADGRAMSMEQAIQFALM